LASPAVERSTSERTETGDPAGSFVRLQSGRGLSPQGQRIAPYFVLFGTLAITFSLWTYASRTARARDEERFAALADRNAAAIEQRFLDQAVRLKSISALFAESRIPTRAGFEAVALATLKDSSASGFVGVGFCPWLERDVKSPWEAFAAKEYGSQFSIWPEKTPPFTFPTLYLSPLTAAAKRALGFNGSSDPERKRAILKARTTGELTLSRSLTLISDRASGRKSLILYWPVYQDPLPPARTNERERQLLGAVFSALRIEEFFRILDRNLLGDPIAMRVRGGDESLYESMDIPGNPDFQVSRKVQIADQTWNVDFFSTLSYDGDSAGRFVPLVPFLGVVISGLLFSLSLEQRASRERIRIQAAALEQQVAERSAAEAEVRRLNEGLESQVRSRTEQLSQTNQELQAFVYSVSHDLRTPLRTVDGFSHALIEDYGGRLDETGLDYINRVRKAAKRMDELIAALLTLSRINRLEVEAQALDLGAMAQESFDMAKTAHAGDSDPVLSIEGNLEAYGDPKMIHAVMDNLIGNAVKFSRHNAAPRIEVGQRESVFFVRDNGVGFDMAHAEKLFQPFERLHASTEFQGTGIGLATVQRIILRHTGRIWAESSPGAGATFFFTLPESPL
jgi:signal transduction histidine kinase